MLSSFPMPESLWGCLAITSGVVDTIEDRRGSRDHSAPRGWRHTSCLTIFLTDTGLQSILMHEHSETQVTDHNNRCDLRIATSHLHQTALTTYKRGRQKGGVPDFVLSCSENKSEQKLEEIGANRKKSGYFRKQGAQIGTNLKKTRKSEQIGVTPFCRPQTGGFENCTDNIKTAGKITKLQTHEQLSTRTAPGSSGGYYCLCGFFFLNDPRSWHNVHI